MKKFIVRANIADFTKVVDSAMVEVLKLYDLVVKSIQHATHDSLSQLDIIILPLLEAAKLIHTDASWMYSVANCRLRLSTRKGEAVDKNYNIITQPPPLGLLLDMFATKKILSDTEYIVKCYNNAIILIVNKREELLK